MKNKLVLLLSGLLLSGSLSHAAPLGTAFTYQGRLDQNGQATPNGNYTMRFGLYDAPAPGGNLVNVTNLTVAVTNGLFTADLNFGPNAFAGEARWLEISVSTNNGFTFTTLLPRTRVAPTPNAIYAATSGNVATGQVVKSLNGLRDDVTLLAGSGISLTSSGNGLTLAATGTGTSPWAVLGTSAYYNGGNVGIGTATPAFPFHLNSSATGSSVLAALLEPNLGNGAFNQLYLGRNSVGNGCGTFTYIYNSSDPGSSVLSLGLYNSSFTFNVLGNGNIGIGTTTPQGRLEIVGQDALRLTGYQPFLTLYDDNAGYASARIQAADGNFHFRPSGGHATFWATDFWLGHPSRRGSPGRALVDGGADLHLNFDNDWANTIIGGGNVSVCTLTIRGGCDLAEPFPMKEEEIEKGSVVVIDDEHPGRLKCSTRAYDTRVAGIVSGANGINPGISLKQEGTLDQGQNVALTGRVYVQADASNGAIKPGDLLTTSDTPGHAMKVVDHGRAQGAILGKAMSALKKGTGLVLVLVTLQ